jgi:ribosomal protein L37AE/L43A
MTKATRLIRRRKDVRIKTEGAKSSTALSNSSTLMRKCHVCGNVYAERNLLPYGRIWICKECLSTINIKDLRTLEEKYGNGQ